jgi:hypothetical protein
MQTKSAKSLFSLTVLGRSFAERPVIIMNGSQEVRINRAVRSAVLPVVNAVCSNFLVLVPSLSWQMVSFVLPRKTRK